jgi:hypothetical protein
MSGFVGKLAVAQVRVAKEIDALDREANSGHPDSLDAVRKQIFLQGIQSGLEEAMMLYKLSTGWVMD